MSRHRHLVFVFSLAAAALALAGCAPSTLPPPDGSPNSTSPTTGGPLSGTPEPDSLDDTSSANAPPEGVTRYECDSGTVIDVRYPDSDTAVVAYDGTERPMHVAISADGARYVGHTYEWWTRGSGRGSEGTLYAHTADNATGNTRETCHETR